MSAGDNAAEANHRVAPVLNSATVKRIAAISVTTSSVRHDLSLRLTQVDDGHYYTFKAVGGTVYLAFNLADAGTVDEAALATGVTECFAIPDGAEEDWQVPSGYHWLIVKGSAACALRIALSSKNPNQEFPQPGGTGGV
jgi:hypothetical protein